MRRLAILVLFGGCAGPSAPAQPDAGPGADDAGGPRPHCRGAGPLPGWASATAASTLRASCPGLALEVAALGDGVAHLRYLPDAEAVIERSWSAIERPAVSADVTLAGDGADAELCTPALAITVRADCRLEVRDATGAVLVEDGDAPGFTADAAGVTLTRHTPAGERFYGLGERTGGLDRRGRRLTFWNTDAYDSALGGWDPDADPLYQSIPFWIGLRDGVAHGVFTDDTHRLDLDLAAAAPERVTLRSPARTLDQYVIAGPSIRTVIERYTAITGRHPLPPRWALGYHQSRWGYAPSTRLTDLAAQFRGRGLAADGLWLDIQHLRGFRTFSWDPAGFADPAGLIAALAAADFQLTVIADPGIKVDPGWPVYDGGVAGGHFLREPGGAVYQGVVWPGPSVFPDFTRTETRAWWGAHIGDLVDLGVRGIWLDVNEPTTFPEGGGGNSVPDDLVTGDGATLAEVHNVYAVLEARATWEGMRDAAPMRRPFVLSRAGAPGIQRYAAVWTGDAPSSWASFRTTLPMLLGLGLSGVPFVGSDVGGYSGGASPELFARWIALGSVSPFFRGHVTNGVGDQEPWAFGPEVEEISRRVIAERYRLLPYLYSLFAEAEATGAPVLRPMVFEFQDDPATWDLDDQAMLGPFLLIAPVNEPGATTRRVYLPAGRWFELRSGAVHDGPATIDVEVTLAALPTFVRAGAILPGWPPGTSFAHTAALPAGPRFLDVYPGDAPSELVVHDDAGDGFAYQDGGHARIRYRVEPRGGGVTISAEDLGGSYQPPARPLRVRIRRIDAAPTAVRLDGAAVASSWDAEDRSLLVELPAGGAFTLEVDHDGAIVEPRPRVRVPIEVRLPPGTAADEVIHIATSVNAWAHQPLERIDATTARGLIEVDRGAWFLYKFSRGSWDTVEKNATCGELSNRYRFGAANEQQLDAVARWRDDGCNN